MEYHQDRFKDFSLMVFKNGKLVALLPANKVGDSIYSHEGLTYGGILLNQNSKFEFVYKVFFELLKYLEKNNIKYLILKELPKIYNVTPNDEITYLLFILQSKLYRRDTLSVINLEDKIKVTSNRLEGYRKGLKYMLEVRKEESFDLFWNSILIKNLKEKHQVQPVHSLEEITFLKREFPENIHQFNVYYENEIVAGTTIFETKHVAHSQYIAVDSSKKYLGSLDFLHLHLINEVFKEKKYFDFGISNEKDGLQINRGLQFWKEGFGARTVTQDFYKVSTSNYHILKTLFI